MPEPAINPRLLPLLQQALPRALAGDAQAVISRLVQEAAAAQIPASDLASGLCGSAEAVQARDSAVALALARAAVAAQPTHLRALRVAGRLAEELGDQAAARDALGRVLAHPEAPPTDVLVAANALVRLGDQTSAVRAARKAFEALGEPLAWASTVLYIAQRVADFAWQARLTEQLRAAHARGQTVEARELPRSHLLWCDDPAINGRVMAAWSSRALPRATPLPPLDRAAAAGRPLRLGYLSSDFRDHPTGHLLLGLLRRHDPAAVEVHLFCSGWDDGSATRRELARHCVGFHGLSGLDDRSAAEQIREQGIEVLVELNGPTRAQRMGILVHRPAPVQLAWLGWPGTLASPCVDFLVADAGVIPPGQEVDVSERLIRLSPSYQPHDFADREPPLVPSREALGLPVGSPVLGVFNAVNKITPDAWACWMRILQAVPGTVLWLLDPGPVAWQRLQAAIREAGLEPARLRRAPALPRAEHLARLGVCDLMLDPWPYGGHTSTTEALFAGVPVLALEGRNFAARVSASLLRAAGLDALVTPDAATYEARAVQWLRDPGALARLKARLHEELPRSPLFDMAGRARQFEAACRAARDAWLNGEVFQDIDAAALCAEGGWRAVAAGAAATAAASRNAQAPLVVDLYVPSHSYGLTHDAEVLEEALQARPAGPGLRARRIPVPLAVSEGREPMAFPGGLGRLGQLAIFIERVFEADWLAGYRHRALLVNPEWLEPPSAAAAAHWIDTFLHKSRAAITALTEAFPEQRHVYVGFTSKDPGVRVNDYLAFSHFRGRSRRRMTGEIQALWQACPELPTLWLQVRGQDVPGNGAGWQRQGNMHHFSGWLAPEAYFPALARGGIQLCTSQVEGFGHYINEARAMAALVITLDAPPMNELITPKNGILVPARPAHRQALGQVYQTSRDRLSEAVNRALAMPEAARAERGRRARADFLAQREAFRLRLARWVEEIGVEPSAISSSHPYIG
ncbi:hypothetical protein [Ectothiorhodospira sp. BSL-9]|uniref:O-linked N-acetylglucosamine transferase family protein n=1 Tax=Ectothiorhodospira sp. BSL-9 TaxID=1442136 RepID=UPI0007B5239D|nr:hypothetical protein [Ectothiorhodospira sp. BSL-9]